MLSKVFCISFSLSSCLPHSCSGLMIHPIAQRLLERDIEAGRTGDYPSGHATIARWVGEILDSLNAKSGQVTDWQKNAGLTWESFHSRGWGS